MTGFWQQQSHLLVFVMVILALLPSVHQEQHASVETTNTKVSTREASFRVRALLPVAVSHQ
jgi:hypothetical protein